MIRKVTYSEYLHIANSFLKRHGFDIKNDLPINVELLCDTAGINLIPIPNLWRGFNVKGVVVRRSDGYDIALDQTHWFDHSFSSPFTIAEELGHILLHSQFFAGAYTVEDAFKIMDSLSDESYRKMENQAKNVGTFLLLPREKFRLYTLNFVKANEDRLREEIFIDKEELGEKIADMISRELEISKKVLELVINKRYPSPLLIDEILTHFGVDMLF